MLSGAPRSSGSAACSRPAAACRCAAPCRRHSSKHASGTLAAASALPAASADALLPSLLSAMSVGGPLPTPLVPLTVISMMTSALLFTELS